jgi:hypothetical protein
MLSRAGKQVARVAEGEVYGAIAATEGKPDPRTLLIRGVYLLDEDGNDGEYLGVGAFAEKLAEWMDLVRRPERCTA